MHTCKVSVRDLVEFILRSGDIVSSSTGIRDTDAMQEGTRIHKKLQKQMHEHLSEKQEKDYGLTLREREFVEEYEALLQTMGKDAVIRRENKTKSRKKEAALDEAKDG